MRHFILHVAIGGLLLHLNHSTGVAQTTELYADNGIKVTAHQTDCSDPANGVFPEFLLLAIENLTDDELSVSFRKNIWYGEKCLGCGASNAEYVVQVKVLPNETVRGTCRDGNGRLRVLNRMLDNIIPDRLQKLQLVDVQVSRIKKGQ